MLSTDSREPPHSSHPPAHGALFTRLSITKGTAMRYFILLLLLVGCGNVDKGIAVKEHDYSIKPSPAMPSAAVIDNSITYGPCKNLIAYGPQDSNLNGASACASTSNSNIVLLKVNAYFPINTRYCLVPFNSSFTYGETCFTINGQSNITLGNSSFTGVSLVKESDLGYYKQYLVQPLTPPSFAYALLR